MAHRKNIICAIALLMICSVLVSCAGTLNTKIDRDGNPIDETSETITSGTDTSGITSGTTTGTTTCSETSETTGTSDTSGTTSTSESSETSETSETTSQGTPTPTPIDPNDLPDYYNLVELGYTPPVENQGHYGSCQSEAFTTIMESRLLVQGVRADISEWAFFHCLNNYGFHYSSVGDTALSASGLGVIITEQEAPYPDDFYTARTYGERTEGYVLPSQYTGRQDYSVTNVYDNLTDESMSNDEIVAIAKSWLYRNYALGGGFDFGEDALLYFSDDGQSFYSTNPHGHINHMMTIVGYDDNYPKENFKTTPSRDGALLVQNSWGTDEWNGTGFFWISYDDAMLNKIGLFTLDVVVGDNFDFVDYYDVNGQWFSISGNYSSTSETCGLVFTADSALDIDAIGIYAAIPNENYRVYLDLSGNMEKSILVAEGTCAEYGYSYVPLNSTYHIDAGTNYSFVIEYSGGTSGDYLIPIDIVWTAQDAVDLTVGRTSGVTFVEVNGSWRDVTSMHDQYGNICFKVYGHRA